MDFSEIVWARRNNLYWPGKLVAKPPEELESIPKGKVCVFFFGSKTL